MSANPVGWTLGFRVLVDPRAAARAATKAPSPWAVLGVLALYWTALGLGTLPRQLALLSEAFAPTTDPALSAGRDALTSGLVRLIVVDRLVPVPAALLGAALLVVAAEPVLMLSRDRRPALAAVAALGLAPLLVGRLGELAFTWLVNPLAAPSPGAALTLPHRFATGARLFWVGESSPPAWVELLETRANLVTLWCAALWAVGLSQLDSGRVQAWHVVLALGCLAVAGIATWAIGPMVVPMVLRGLG
jgi:hypothetical protein